MRAFGLLTVVAACSYNPQRGGDEIPDAEICDVTWPYTPSNVSPCAGDPTDILRLTEDHTLDTGTGDLFRGTTLVTTLRLDGTDPVVLALLGLEIGPLVTLRIVGAGPLVIAVHGSASIAGNIVVSAAGTQPGSGAATCTTQPGQNADGNKAKAAGGGGAGGAFGGAGGTGGNGDTDPAPQTPGGVGALETGEPTLVPLRGGCSGGAGGDDHPLADPVATLGMGGGGGGALQITARDRIDLLGTATIQANGGGGARAVNTGGGNDRHAGAGGGGGGSGGAIFLESKLVLIAATATLCANGGGGGGGSHETDVTTSGTDGACAEIAAGGGTGGNGGDGGDGGFATTPATMGLAGGGSDGGGGGGGGSVGRIRVRSIDQMPTGFVSTPPAQF